MMIPGLGFTQKDWQYFDDPKSEIRIGISIESVLDRPSRFSDAKILFMKMLNAGKAPITIEWISTKEQPKEKKNFSIDFIIIGINEKHKEEEIKLKAFPEMEYFKIGEAKKFNTVFEGAEFDIRENDKDPITFTLYVKVAGNNEPIKAPIKIDIIKRNPY